jgi:hypothetical protein
MNPAREHPFSASDTAPPPRRLRIWLITVTILAALGVVAAIPATLFGTYMSAFAADDPSASTSAVLGFMAAVFACGLGFVALLIAGVVGGWVAYRKRRGRLAFRLSLLAAGPMLISLLAVAAFVVTSFIWTASIQAPVPSIP